MITKYRVLLVEDNTADARLLIEHLNELPATNIQLTWVTTLADAINATTKERFDAVLLDLNLPDSEGAETISAMNSQCPDLAIIVMTGIDDEQAEANAIHLGAQDYLVKGEVTGKLFVRAVRYAIDRKRISLQLFVTSQKLDQHIIELELAMKELESFTYTVSHDLRGPLHTIDGFCQILVQDFNDKLDSDGKDSLNRIVSSAKKMNALIDDLLYLSKVSRWEMIRQTVNLSSEVSEVLNELQANEPERTIELRVAPDICASADPKLIHLALANLINNAWKFTRKNSLPVIEFGTIEIAKRKSYYVKDNGAGFDEKFAEKLFLPFQRLHSESEFPGTGIGLSIVEKVVRRHGGKIWAESNVGNGAVFYFTLGE